MTIPIPRGRRGQLLALARARCGVSRDGDLASGVGEHELPEPHGHRQPVAAVPAPSVECVPFVWLDQEIDSRSRLPLDHAAKFKALET
jgi:hypothetical protein